MITKSSLERTLGCSVLLSDTDTEYYREQDLIEEEIYDGEYILKPKPGATPASRLADEAVQRQNGMDAEEVDLTY